MNEIITQKKAKEINELHAQIELSARKTIEIVILIGNKLNEIKADLKHGKFNNWCEENLNFSRTTIFRYMSISQNKHKIKDASTPTEAINLLTKCSNMKHLENGIYLKNMYGANLTVYVKDGYIGYVQILGLSIHTMGSIEYNTYLDYSKKLDLPVPDASFLFISEDKNCPYFKEYFGHVPNPEREKFCYPGGSWFEKHLGLITLVAPEQYHS